LEGSAAYMRKTGMHPGQMKDAVCSPGGTTIQGVRALEEGGLRAAAMNAVIRAFEKTHK
ncbi:MAG: pyrroline-5-carboxylate reductase, partial [Clostridia bacterium]|nr:pyrroline-5-carboxylate reductase [Clostridia bacterium]